MNVTRAWVEHNPFVGVVELRPNQSWRGGPPMVYFPVQDDMCADAGQLAVPPPPPPQADADLPRTVASTTGKAAMAARPMKARRCVSTRSAVFAATSSV